MSHFEKIIIFLAEIQYFRFGRADLPVPGQDRVKEILYKSVVVFTLFLFLVFLFVQDFP